MRIVKHTSSFEIPFGSTVVLDIETTGLGLDSDIVLVGLTWDGETAHIVTPEAFSCLRQLVDCDVVAHNKNFDLKMLRHKNIVDLVNNYRVVKDTMLLHHLVDENAESNGLEALITRYFGETKYKTDFWSKYEKFDDAPEEDRYSYLANDLIYTWRLYTVICKHLHESGVPSKLQDNVNRLADVLLRTEHEGIRVDIEYLTKKGTEVKSLVEKSREAIFSSAANEIELIEYSLWTKEIDKYKTPARKALVEKPTFNPSSSKQLIELLYDKLKLPLQRNPKTKQASTDYDSLQNIRHLHPVVEQLQILRENEKVYSSFIEGTLKHLKNGRIYPSFSVNGTLTGRISHSTPNLGQLPAHGGIRGIYIPDPEEGFGSSDYSQLEVCISAHYTQDKNLLKIVLEGASQHDITAAGLGIKRDTAKTLNFAMQYGASHYKVASILGVSEKEGLHAYNKYWETYIGQKHKMEECRKMVDDGIPIRTIYGRLRHFPVAKRAPWDKAYRQAWNFLVQGTGADITSEALVDTDDRLRGTRMGRGLFTVHDEVFFAVNLNYADEAKEIVKYTLARVGEKIGLSVPLKSECAIMKERWED